MAAMRARGRRDPSQSPLSDAGRGDAGERANLLSLTQLHGCLVERVQVGDQILDLLFVLDAGEGHLGAWDLRLGILDVVAERCLIPSDARFLVGVRVAVAFDRSRLSADQAVEHGPHDVLRGIPDLMAGLANGEDLFARAAASWALASPNPAVRNKTASKARLIISSLFWWLDGSSDDFGQSSAGVDQVDLFDLDLRQQGTDLLHRHQAEGRRERVGGGRAAGDGQPCPWA